MLSSSELQAIDFRFRPIRLIWMAMLAALVVYAVIAVVMDVLLDLMPLVGGPDDAGLAKFGYGLYGIAAIALVLAYFFRRALAQRKDDKAPLDRLLSFLGDPASGEGVDSVQAASSWYSSGMLICLGLCEMVGLCGFVGFIARADYLQLGLLLGLSAVAMVYVRPVKQEVVDLAAKLEQDREARERFPKY